MSTTTIIVTGVIFLLCITIYVISKNNKKKKEIRLLDNISRLSGTDPSSITQYDIWNNSVIGLNNLDAELYFIKNTAEDQSFQKVSITEVQRCWVNEVSRTVSIKESIIKVVEKVEVIMINKVKNKPDTVIEFFNQNSGKLDLSGELQLAEKWCNLLNETIASTSK